jgi:hypothetical protein
VLVCLSFFIPPATGGFPFMGGPFFRVNKCNGPSHAVKVFFTGQVTGRRIFFFFTFFHIRPSSIFVVMLIIPGKEK